MKHRSAKPVSWAVALIVARAQALAKRYTDDRPEASVDAFLVQRIEESGE